MRIVDVPLILWCARLRRLNLLEAAWWRTTASSTSNHMFLSPTLMNLSSKLPDALREPLLRPDTVWAGAKARTNAMRANGYDLV
jgi:hypothetical protein